MFIIKKEKQSQAVELELVADRSGVKLVATLDNEPQTILRFATNGAVRKVQCYGPVKDRLAYSDGYLRIE